ncbi:Hsp20/alpha crystallin family protein [Rhodococcus sp. IEGM 1366]|uniref:Hsp20/alpha crystallin family protein n=1 Tax=Rhodococcus sp. IEGM 1366 TaxID=3082223 RepID=UPI0029551199|nr:Hsp20/alpha crystallin family protein [Rhodococcus sp. IEGM 1366]MDV8070552.1 Hsp20/alpha crystallin family protein [Rhodococcus sp. IEGM 1366]
MSVLSPRSSHPAMLPAWPSLPDWSDLMARFEAMPAWSSLEGHMIRVEEHLEKGRYVLRAELPGVDPEHDVDISVRDGQLTIKAERTEKQEEGTRSEFHYGSFFRSMSLPTGAQEDDIAATYDDGILMVTVPVSEAQSPEKHVEVKKAIAKGGKKN